MEKRKRKCNQTIISSIYCLFIYNEGFIMKKKRNNLKKKILFRLRTKIGIWVAILAREITSCHVGALQMKWSLALVTLDGAVPGQFNSDLDIWVICKFCRSLRYPNLHPTTTMISSLKRAARLGCVRFAVVSFCGDCCCFFMLFSFFFCSSSYFGRFLLR